MDKQKEFEVACKDYAFEGKAQQWQFGFTKGFSEGWDAAQKEQAELIKDLLAENNELKAIVDSYITD